MRRIPLVTLVLLTSLQFVPSVSAETVKKSNSGICHDESSRSYSRTKNFVAYATIDDCLAAGGRLPKGAAPNITKAIKEADREGREYSKVYDRDDWKHWSDHDKDCQNTRAELLIATSEIPVTFKTRKQCVVATGKWYGAYSGEYFYNAKELDLDHVVPLKHANGHGGMKLSKAEREQFANDPENLILVDLSLNRQKGAKGVTDWMPPLQTYRCDYLKSFDHVMAKYKLTYTPSELRVVNKMKSACGL
jgi:hypothetical protein